MAITDNFTNTDGTGIASHGSWAYMAGGTTNFQIQGNALAISNTAGEIGARRTETGFPDDHYAQLTVSTLADTVSQVIGVAVRCQAAASGDYYGFYAEDNLSQMFEYDGTNWSQLGSNGGGINAAQTIRLTCSGTSLTPAIGGSTQNPPGAQTDGTYTTGAPGISGFNAGEATGTIRYDDFECTDNTVTPQTTVRVSTLFIMGMG